MAIEDPNTANGPKTPSLGWNNGGMAAAAMGRWRLATTVPPVPICTTVAVTLRWVQRQPSALAAAGDRSRNAPLNGPRSVTVTWIDRPPFWTISTVPKGRVRCAAVIAAQLSTAPEAVRRPHRRSPTVQDQVFPSLHVWHRPFRGLGETAC